MTKQVDLYGIILKLNKLDKLKQQKFDEITQLSKTHKFTNKEVQQEQIMNVVAELRDIEGEISRIHGITVELPEDFNI
ncbi:hypothetical protein [Cytobacillus gottheilii]|uniref:hypothetical protein n=1 Tax=Cytobacillus gottheilii TaxID=859144 RepID=UPI0009BA3E99|nr:hypothetical protein [Cytobacillus gottheilii]